MSTGLDDLTRLHYLAHVLYAESRRLEQHLPKSAPVQVFRWLVTSDDHRRKAVEAADAWMREHSMSEDDLGTIQGYEAWKAGEEEQRAARGDART